MNMTNTRKQKSTQNSRLNEFWLETLSYSITKFSAVKARWETKLNYYIEGVQTDILPWGLVSEKSDYWEILILLLTFYEHFETQVALHLIIYAWNLMHQQCCDQSKERRICDTMSRRSFRKFQQIWTNQRWLWRMSPRNLMP